MDKVTEALIALIEDNTDAYGDGPYIIDPDPYPTYCVYCGRDYHKPDCPVVLGNQALTALRSGELVVVDGERLRYLENEPDAAQFYRNWKGGWGAYLQRREEDR